MGIKSLNRYLLERCSKRSINKQHLREYANKTLVIDTSIYMYKFAAEDALIENMYLMISIFKKYHITPIFIFDGKPPNEKKDLLSQRRADKKDAQQKYNVMKTVLDNQVLNEDERKTIICDMDILKKQFIRIKDADIQKTKALMSAYGVTYFDALGEADALCCYLVKTGRAWGCVSDDMDMFVYGCARVIRHLSLLNHTVIFYDTEKILNDINMTEGNFRDIMVLSGTDYNINNETNLVETLKWFNEYSKSNDTMEFYDWLSKYTKYVKNKESLINIRNMFILDCEDNHLRNAEFYEYCEMKTHIGKLKNILSDDGFMFVY